MSLRSKLIFLFILVITVMSVLIGYMSYHSAEKMIVENKKDEMSNSVNLIDISITSLVLSIEEMSEYTLENYMEEELDESELSADIKLKKWLERFINAHQSIADIYIISKERGLLYSHNEESDIHFLIEEIRKTDFKSGNNYVSYPDLDERGKQRVYFLKLFPVKSRSNTIGDKVFFIVEFDTDNLANMLINNTGTFRHQYTMIVDREIISATNSMLPDFTELLERRLLRGEREFELLQNNQLYYVYGQYNGLTGWNTVTVVPGKDIVPKLTELQIQIISVVVCVVLLSWGIAIVFAFSITVPIKQLTFAMQRSQAGELDIYVETKRNDEIGYMIRTFNKMLVEIRELIQKLTEEKSAQKDAELKALQAQINPHFLYNTLDTINWMLIPKQEMEISAIVVALGDLLKYAISDKYRLVSVAEEEKYTQSYLMIQKCRMEERLQYEINIDEAVRNIKIPKLLFQPIVENAIIHGIEPKEHGGKIWIVCYRHDEDLMIQIEDDGIGIGDEALEKIFAPENIGIGNVNRRIQLHYGEEYGVKIGRNKTEGTIVTIRLPLNKA